MQHMRPSHQNPHGLSRNSSLEASHPAENETPEQRTRRIINSMPPELTDDPQRILKALRKAAHDPAKP